MSSDVDRLYPCRVPCQRVQRIDLLHRLKSIFASAQNWMASRSGIGTSWTCWFSSLLKLSAFCAETTSLVNPALASIDVVHHREERQRNSSLPLADRAPRCPCARAAYRPDTPSAGFHPPLEQSLARRGAGDQVDQHVWFLPVPCRRRAPRDRGRAGSRSARRASAWLRRPRSPVRHFTVCR